MDSFNIGIISAEQIKVHAAAMTVPFFLTRRQRASAQGYSDIEAAAEEKNRSWASQIILILVVSLCMMKVVAIGAIHFWSPTTDETNSSATLSVVEQKPLSSNTNPKQKTVVTLVQHAAEEAKERAEQCRGFNWQQACDRITTAGARRRHLVEDETTEFTQLEEYLMDSDDPSVTYDEHCLRVYRLDISMEDENIHHNYNITFPYHASNLLRAGGNHTMALFIQHGAMRDADAYFCSFRSLMLEQEYRPFNDIMVIAPDFNYRNDPGVLPTDAFWNATKPWGDWRAGAESDPECCGNGRRSHGGRTISSFAILDQMLAILTDKTLYPNMDKISFVGHSAGGQMVQRYAIMSELAAKWDVDERVDVEFVIANPSSYSYLDERRWTYSCGECQCDSMNCTCDTDCSTPAMGSQLEVPGKTEHNYSFVCHDSAYNGWPYGLSGFSDRKHSFPYPLASGPKRAARAYRKRDVVYLVGQNDTCNDGLPTCSESCWKRSDFLADEGPCFRNHMDTRCPAMLEGPYRRARGLQYMKYLEAFYGEKTHVLHVVPGVGHNATAMFGSDIGLHELFD